MPDPERPDECPCQEVLRLRGDVFRLRKTRGHRPTMKEHQKALSTIDHLLEENRELRQRLSERTRG